MPYFHREEIDKFILVYTMGKVGSTALVRSLQAVNIFCRHLQWVTPETQCFFDRLETIWTVSDSDVIALAHTRLNAARAYQALRDPGYASLLKVVTAIRAPIDQILSCYFHGIGIIERWLGERGIDVTPATLRDEISESVAFYLRNPDRSLKNLTDDLATTNYGRIWFCWVVHNYLHWFDQELRPVFPVEILTGRMRGGFQLAGNVLILKLEDFATVAEPIVGAYSQRPHFKLLRENVAADKSYGALYREVTDTIRLPTEFVNRLCDSEYVQHFYSERERAQMRARWSPVTASQAR